LHARGFVHCDVRPPNIMKAAGNAQRAALVDFGAARQVGAEDYFTHGTLNYASPRVLDAYSAKEKINVTVTDDMLSFARCVIAVYHNILDDERLCMNNVDRIRACWREIDGVSLFAKTLMEFCNHHPPDYDNVCNFLRHSIIVGIAEVEQVS